MHLYRLKWKILGKIIILTTNLITTVGQTITKKKKKKSNHILQRSNANARNAIKRPDICITEKYIKNFTPITVPGNSTYSGITKHGRKICVVGESHIKRIKQFTTVMTVGKQFATVITVGKQFATVITVGEQFVTVITVGKQFVTVITIGKQFVTVLCSRKTFFKK